MKLEHAQQIVDHLNDEGIDATVYEEYSGRFMYGRTTAGVVTRHSDDVCIAIGRLGIPHDPRRDSMGLDQIVY